MSSKELNKKQIADRGILASIKHKDVLFGLAEIAAYSGMSIATIRRAIRRGTLIAGNAVKGGKYATTKQNIDIFISRQHLAEVIRVDGDKLPYHNRARRINEKLTKLLESKDQQEQKHQQEP